MFEDIFGGGENNIFSLVKSLLDDKDIERKTDLNIKQIRVLTVQKWYSLLFSDKPDIQKLTPSEKLQMTLIYYQSLMISIGRGSRKEITEMMKFIKPEFVLPDNPLMMQKK